ncbi:uncharacterized protein LOC120459040 [Pimephales promelas]|uniref:uncharacterized protein LOC120459040 n=1 Tax=Pimephales promelas TaxID=90988 RepID=UPI001955622C|nr:uncharacterized protein LOC120459040 [Pimephales promelas]XP_039502861.1 uncharacterized protein LOC120459040 [Pimephales promelas]
MSEEKASFPTKRIFPIVENAFKASKKHKNKRVKKEKKDKSKAKCVPSFLLHDGCCETDFTQKQETKKRKKTKKKNKREEDFQKPKIKKQPNKLEDTQLQPIIFISPDQETKQQHSTENESHRRVKERGKIIKRVIFNLPTETNQPATNYNEHGKKQFVGESSLESSTAEEMNSQDLFITQKSFLDPCVEISSSSSCNEATIATEATAMKAPEKSSSRSTAEATTQTENFFTFSALSSSLRFQQQKNTATCSEEPVDLSLPNRTRRTHRPKHPALESANPPKLKISDTSSEDGDAGSKSKGDLLQLKVVQTRLNESFFFKVKGEDSPKPMCPLMKFTESVEKRGKK